MLQQQEVVLAWKRMDPTSLQPGDAVLYWVEKRAHKLAPRWAGPAIVKWVGAKGAVGVKIPGKGRTKVFARHHVKLCTADPRTEAPVAKKRGIKCQVGSVAIIKDNILGSGHPPTRRPRR